jgi:thymidine phosphorylase
LTSGAGLERFRRMVAQQGGDPRIVDDYSLLPSAPRSHVVTASTGGYLASLDAFLVGRASMLLGAGREQAADVIDPGVGITLHAKPGDRLNSGDPVLEMRFRSERGLPEAIRLANSAMTFTDARPSSSSLIIDEII